MTPFLRIPALWLKVICLCALQDVCLTAKILLMPALHHSHVNIFSMSGKALLDAGHDVMVLTSPKFKGPVMKHGLKPILNPISDEADFTQAMYNNTEMFEKQSFLKTLETIQPTFRQLCRETNNNVLLMTFLTDQRFDLAMVDGMAMRHCMYSIPYRLSIPYILFTPIPDPWSSGVPVMASIEPSVLQSFSNQLSLMEKIKTSINYYVLYSGVLSGTFNGDDLEDKSLPLPSLRELHHRAEMVLVNQEIFCVDYPRVSMPHYQYVGGALTPTHEKLNADLMKWVSGAPYGVIVVTLGSFADAQKVWEVLEDKLMEALGKMTKWRAIVQRDLTTRTSETPLPTNVKCFSWLPQEALLAHPRTRLFITHGGNTGQMEAIFHAVPMLVLPIRGDQFYNAVRIQQRGYGLTLDIQDSNADELHGAMAEIIGNNSFLGHVRKCSDILRSQPTMVDRVVFWVEQVLRFGGSHLKPPTLQMSLGQIMMIDIVLLFAFIAVVCSLILVVFIYFSVKRLKIIIKSVKSKSE